MINLIKRDLISIWEKTKVFNILVLIVLVLTLIIPKDLLQVLFFNNKANTIMNFLVPMISSLIVLFYGIAMYIYITFRMVLEIKEDQYMLLLVSDKKPWQIVLSKIIVNIFIVLIIGLILTTFGIIISKFNSDSTSFFTSDINMLDSIMATISLGMLFFFSYVLAKSLKPKKEKPIVKTIVIIIIIGLLFSGINLINLQISGAEISFSNNSKIVENNNAEGVINVNIYNSTDYENSSYGFGITIDDSRMNEDMYNIISSILDYIYIGLFTIGSIYLIREKFEK